MIPALRPSQNDKDIEMENELMVARDRQEVMGLDWTTED